MWVFLFCFISNLIPQHVNTNIVVFPGLTVKWLHFPSKRPYVKNPNFLNFISGSVLNVALPKIQIE